MSDHWRLFQEEAMTVLPQIPENSIDSIVTDPPAGISFMGSEWDHNKGGRSEWVAWLSSIMRECLRVLKPGGHALVWALPRTSHWTAWALEDAGFEIRDCTYHLQGNGYPKNKNTLKPAVECWWLVRKELVGTVSENVAQHGTGKINTEASRNEYGRYPSNVIFDESAAELLDAQSGESKSRAGRPRKSKTPGDGWGMTKTGSEYNDEGGASRYFFVAKPSRKERDLGLENGDNNIHKTAKSIELMKYLCRLITPPGGVILDPFAGSGSTGCAALLEGFYFVGIEREEKYVKIAEARLAYWEGNNGLAD